MRNKFAGACKDCGKHVPAGAGHPHRAAARWFVVCIPCVDLNRAGKVTPAPIPATPAQEGGER